MAVKFVEGDRAGVYQGFKLPNILGPRLPYMICVLAAPAPFPWTLLIGDPLALEYMFYLTYLIGVIMEPKAMMAYGLQRLLPVRFAQVALHNPQRGF